MNFSEMRKSSFVTRILNVLAITLLLYFTAIVAIENKELEKILPPSTFRSLAMLFGYAVALLSSNYLMAIRGRNFTAWKTELLISFNYILFFASILLPWLFPLSVDIDQPWYKPLAESTKNGHNYWFYGLFIFLLPMLWITSKKVRLHFSSK